VTPASPALFSKNANASGVAAATAERIQTGGARNNAPVYRCDTPSANCVPVPIDLGAETDEVYLSLYGTGIRQNGGLANVRLTLGGLPAEVLYAGPQTQFTGLDQINVRVPQSLRGRGVVDVVVSVGAMSSNVVTIAVQ
jgi:uncharacterized protein (TIGR03437 family)